MLEESVEEYLRALVEKHGGRCQKTIDRSRRGAPDREVQWLRPMLCAGLDKVELKKPKGKAESHQVRYHRYLAACGIPVYLLDSKVKVDLYILARVERGMHDPSLFSVPCRP